MFHLWAGPWHGNVISTYTRTGVETDVMNGQVVICGHPRFPLSPFLRLFKVINISYISAMPPVTLGWFAVSSLSDTVLIFGKQRLVLSQPRASSLLCLSQLLISSHLRLLFTVKDESQGLSVNKGKGQGRGLCWGLQVSLLPCTFHWCLQFIFILNIQRMSLQYQM